jgi:UPF0176 protein
MIEVESLKNQDTYSVASFYFFFPIPEENVIQLSEKIRTSNFQITGLFLVSPEGFNASICGTRNEILQALASFFTEANLLGAEVDFKSVLSVVKWNSCKFNPFQEWKVDLRKELVTYFGKPTHLDPIDESYLSPEQWHQELSKEDVVVIDTRNYYETTLGMFRGAVDPKIDTFTQFSGFVEGGDYHKDQKILLYCTGGVRCEKLIPDLRSKGYEKVYQLHGGILAYLEQYPDGGFFDGDCFVFDRRIAVNANLEPNPELFLCALCGDPESSSKICDSADGSYPSCKRCGAESKICQSCYGISGAVCSKNCRNQLLIRG